MELNDQQKAAVSSTATRIVVIANPGSGKTSTYIQRIRHLLRNGARADSIVAITFTNAAAAEINKRLNVADPVKLGFIGTLHGFMLRLLQRYGSAIGLPARLTVLDEEEREALLEWCIKRLNYRGKVADVDDAVARGVEHYRTPNQMKRSDPAQLVAYEFYFQVMGNGSLTYDSILELGLMLVKQLNAQRGLCSYDHLLVDEFQDSSRMDVAIYDALDVQTRFFVGDVDQSIFGFRGACPTEMMMLAANPEYTTLPLGVNYRCGKYICSAANQLIKHNVRRIPKSIEAGVDFNGRFTQACFATGNHEVTGICTLVENDIDGAVPPEEIAVLCRTNWMAEEFAEALKARGVPVHARARTDLPPDWNLTRAFLALLSNPENDPQAMKFLTLKFGDQRADEMRTAAQGDYQSINERWLHIESVLAADVTTAMCQVGIGRESIARVGAVAGLLQPEATAAELQMALMQKDATVEETGRGVVVTTMHGAKGREFDVVYLPGWNAGLFPSAQSKDTEEERRLAFVAITRARKLCMVSCAERRVERWGARELVDVAPGTFYKELL